MRRGGSGSGHSPLFGEALGAQGDERQHQNAKYYNYSSTIIAKSLLFLYAETCDALLI